MTNYGLGRKRGPYGTNPGDQWLGSGSAIQKRLDQDGEGLVLVHWINDEPGHESYGEETVYVTANPEMIAEAQEGHERYIAERASRN